MRCIHAIGASSAAPPARMPALQTRLPLALVSIPARVAAALAAPGCSSPLQFHRTCG